MGNISAVFTIFAKKAGRERRVPIEISADPYYLERDYFHAQTEEQLLARIDRSLQQIRDGKYENVIAKTRIACYHKYMNTQEELIILKEKTRMNWKEIAQYFDIPYRTVQDWYLGKRSMPDYLLRLMRYKLEMEHLLRENGGE